jgi:uncharacterized membrane protein YjdF
MVINLLSFWLLIRFNERTRKPITSATIYAFIVLLSKAMYLSQAEYITWVILSVTCAFIGATAIFWLLDRFQDSVLLWVMGLIFSFLFVFGAEYVLLTFKPDMAS